MLKDEIEQYKQADGLISPDKNPSPDSTGNGILYTSIYYIALMLTRQCSIKDQDEYNSIIKKCVKFRGIFNRSATKKEEQISKDDYIGILVASKLLNLSYPQDIYRRGQHRRFIFFKWNYNNLDLYKFTAQSWFGRFFEFPLIVKVCANKPTNIFDRVRYAIHLLYVALFKVEDTTSVMLSCLSQEVIKENETLLLMLAGIIFENRYKRHWRNFGNVLAKHLGRGDILKGSYHPLSRYWP